MEEDNKGEIEIEVGGEEGAENPQEGERDQQLQAVDELKEQFETLKAQSEAARRERTEALRARADAEAKASQTTRQAQASVLESQLFTLSSGISAAEAEAGAAEDAWAQAMSAGDYAGAARAQRKMQRAEAQLSRLEDAKGELEAYAKTPPKEAPPTDPVEAFVQGRTPRTASWLRAHTDHILDPAKQKAMERAHYSALGAGFDPDTDDYFTHVEEKLGLREVKEKEPQKEVKKRSSAPPVAPANGATGSPASSNTIRVDLSSHERNAATDGTHTWDHDDPKGRYKKGQPIGEKEFARRKYLMQKAGLYDRNMGE